MCDPQLAALLCKLQEPQVSCPSTISQKAAEAALSGPREPIDAMRRAYVERRDAALAVLVEENVGCVPPAGTLYMLVDVTTAGMPTMDFALELLRRHRVSVAPGSVFGPGGEGYVRISLAADPDVLVDGLRRVAKMARAPVGA